MGIAEWLVLKGNNYSFQRFYLLFSLAICLILPFIQISISGSSKIVLLPEVTVFGQRTLFDGFTIVSQGAKNIAQISSQFISWLFWMYWIGVGLFSVRMMQSLLVITKMMHEGEKQIHESHVFVKPRIDLASPLSFFNILFIDKNRYSPEELHCVLIHEKQHEQLGHSFDNVFSEMMVVVQWFNPFVWILRRRLKEVHEFQADRLTLHEGVDAKHYQTLLLHQALGTRHDVGNYFNQLLIKKRFKQMKNLNIGRLGFIKPFAVVIFVGMIALAVSCQKMVDDSNAEKVESATVVDSNGKQNVNDVLFKVVEVMPQFNGGDEGLRVYLGSSINYPPEAINKQISGRVYVEFVVTSTGKVADVKVVRGVHPLLDAEATRVVSSMPDWTPGQQRGKTVNVEYTIPINFALK